MARTRPNVLLICADQWRGDCLSIEGHPALHTPWLDQLALGGVRFTRAYSAVPTCIAARVALFTGLAQGSHGRVAYADGVPWRYPVTLGGEFTRHGYDTIAIGKMHAYPERNRVGFKRVILHDGYLHFGRNAHRKRLAAVDDYLPWLARQLGRKADYFDHGINCNSHVARPWDKPEYTHPTNWAVSQAVDYLVNRDGRKPFFMFLSFHRPHPPYDPPAWAFEQYLHADMPGVPAGDWATAARLGELTGRDFSGSDPWINARRPDTPWGIVRPEILRRARAGYWGLMTQIDHQVNRLLETLDEMRVLGDTWVCFVSDHGELMGDHHFFRKSMPYEGSARVPLILSGPGGSGLLRNAALAQPVELRDVMPTLLECAGLPVPASVEGRSLLPLARGGTPAWREYVHGEHGAFGQSVQWIATGREKYVWFSGTGAEQFFDLAADPTESRDLAPSGDPRLLRWRAALIRELEGREEGFVRDGALVPGRPVRATLRRTVARS
ncbi:MAG: arylsulfatase [Candidatus Coatesbacteria bacterium]